MNLQPGVSSAKSFKCNTQCGVCRVCLYLLVVQCGCNVDTSCAANDEFSPCLGVEVKENVAVKFSGRKSVGTKHARLFVGSDKSLHGTVLQRLVFHNRHDGCNAYTVVGTECSAFSTHPLAVNISLDGVFLEVVGALRSLLRHHVHVCLQYYSLAVLHTRRCGLLHYDVAGSVFEYFHSSLLAEVEQELLYFL